MKKRGPDGAKPFFSAFFHKNHLRFALAVLLALLSVPFDLLVAYLLGAVIDAVNTGVVSSLRRPLLLVACTLPAFLLWRAVFAKVMARFIHGALRQYKALAFERLAAKRISAFSNENTGRYLSVFTNDVNTLETDYLTNIILMVQQGALLVGALVMMLVLSAKLTGASILLGLVPLAAALLTGVPLRKKERAVSDQNERFLSRMQDLLSGFSVIKSFKAERPAAALFDEANRETERKKASRRFTRSLAAGVSEAGAVVTQCGIFFIGAVLAIRGEITAGTVVTFVQMANYIINPLGTIPQYWAQIRAARGLVEKLAALTSENAERRGEPIEPVLRQAITLEHVSFAYEKDKPVLRDLSLRLEAGGKYALVGGSGSGKSTLLNLLMGAYDDYDGAIALDGRELRTVAPDDLYGLMSLIGQNVFLFDDTIRRNITMFRDFPDEAVRTAAARAGLDALLAEKGEDYPCGENGGNLSGGQRQRISIARSLLRGTPVLLLDEATASLDNQTARAVTDAILEMDGLTRLIVTHRLEAQLLERCDRIFVLCDGALREAGTFRELMEEKGYFYSLYTVTNG